MKVRLDSIAPLILHNGDLADPQYPFSIAKKKLTSSRKKTDSDVEEISKLEFLGSFYGPAPRTDVLIPANMLLGMIIKGAKQLKMGNEAKAGIFINKSFVPLEYKGPRTPQELYEDKKFVLRKVIKQGTSSIVRVRPIFDKWAIEFEVSFIEEVISEKSIKLLLEKAGLVCGLGDWRPQHGRFVVSRFEV
jgi:hypothetical protein